MKTYFCIDGFVTPPRNQGQIVTYSYGLDVDHDVIVERRHDGADGSYTYTAYAIPQHDSWDWDPWNGEPGTGDCLGECHIAAEDPRYAP